jgi:galactokinase
MENFFLQIISALEKIATDEVMVKRARHVIGEIERTKKAAEALKVGDFESVSTFK